MAAGIASLKILAHMQAASASDDAADAANKGRTLLIEQKNVRARQQAFERAVGDKELTTGERDNLAAMMGEIGMSTGTLNTLQAENGKYTADAGSDSKISRDNANRVETIRKDFDGKLKEIESQERLDNFGIQELMSRYNQSEQLAASIEKKEGDTQNAVISKIG